jgi:hypothetical protein
MTHLMAITHSLTYPFSTSTETEAVVLSDLRSVPFWLNFFIIMFLGYYYFYYEIIIELLMDIPKSKIVNIQLPKHSIVCVRSTLGRHQ